MVDEPIIRVVLQRHDTDCAVACLAMLAAVSYEDALIALGSEAPDILIKGTWVSQIMRAARTLKLPLTKTRHIHVETDTGLLRIVFTNDDSAHMVVLKEGLIIDTDGTLWDVDVYLAVKKAKPDVLLARSDKAKEG